MQRKHLLTILLFALVIFIATPTHSQSFTVVDTVYTPPNYQDGPLPSTLYLPAHGNGFALVLIHRLGNTPAAFTTWADTLASRGYLALAIEYPDPVNGPSVFPSPASAVKTAIQFLRKNAASWHIDTSKVGVLGHSIGSAIAAEAMIDEHHYAKFGLSDTTDDHIDFAVLFYGLYDFERYTQTDLPITIAQLAAKYFQLDHTVELSETPVLHADRVSAPLLLLHGTNDTRLEYRQSTQFSDSLTAHAKPHELILFQGQGHVFDEDASNQFTAQGLVAKDSVLAYLGRLASHSAVTPEVATNFVLDQNYPNPFNPSTQIDFSLIERGVVTLEVFDMLGRKVQTLIHEAMEAGAHSVKFDAGNLASGIYTARLTTNNGRREMKMVLGK